MQITDAGVNNDKKTVQAFRSGQRGAQAHC